MSRGRSPASHLGRMEDNTVLLHAAEFESFLHNTEELLLNLIYQVSDKTKICDREKQLASWSITCIRCKGDT
jgi:hypothetical protein